MADLVAIMGPSLEQSVPKQTKQFHPRRLFRSMQTIAIVDYISDAIMDFDPTENGMADPVPWPPDFFDKILPLMFDVPALT